MVSLLAGELTSMDAHLKVEVGDGSTATVSPTGRSQGALINICLLIGINQSSYINNSTIV